MGIHVCVYARVREYVCSSIHIRLHTHTHSHTVHCILCVCIKRAAKRAIDCEEQQQPPPGSHQNNSYSQHGHAHARDSLLGTRTEGAALSGTRIGIECLLFTSWLRLTLAFASSVVRPRCSVLCPRLSVVCRLFCECKCESESRKQDSTVSAAVAAFDFAAFDCCCWCCFCWLSPFLLALSV